MKTYKEFCEHYEYALDDKKSKKLYQEYQLQLGIFRKIMEPDKLNSDDNDIVPR